MRILVTGSMGLLGQCVVRKLASQHEVIGTCHTRHAEGRIPVDLTDPVAVEGLLQDEEPSHIIHCAAIRSPEECLADPARAYNINTAAVETLARLSNKYGLYLCHVSTDYVFPGTTPPYAEDATPAPVNLYGRSKLAGEVAARTAKHHLIARIPALYRTDLTDPRNMATPLAEWIRAGETKVMDAVTVRYYTLADDIAAALAFLVGDEVTGTIHLSAKQKGSKASFARQLAVALGGNPEQVEDGPADTSGDTRPLDSHLDTTRYETLGGPVLRDIDTALQGLEK